MFIQPMAPRALAFWLGGAALCLAARGGAQSPLPADAQAAKVIASCAHVAAVTGSDAKGRFSACFQGGELVYVEERASSAPKGPPMRYVYDRGALVYFKTDSAPHATGGGSSAVSASVPVTIEWLPTGEVRRAVRQEHYGEVRLAADVVSAAHARGVALAALARATRPAS